MKTLKLILITAVVILGVLIFAGCGNALVINFETNGGNDQARLKIKEGDVATLPTPTHEDQCYAFEGWYIDEALTQKVIELYSDTGWATEERDALDAELTTLRASLVECNNDITRIQEFKDTYGRLATLLEQIEQLEEEIEALPDGSEDLEAKQNELALKNTTAEGYNEILNGIRAEYESEINALRDKELEERGDPNGDVPYTPYTEIELFEQLDTAKKATKTQLEADISEKETKREEVDAALREKLRNATPLKENTTLYANWNVHDYGAWTTEGQTHRRTCSKCSHVQEITTQYTVVNANGVADADGDYVLFGSYPQSEVLDTAIDTALDGLAGELPTAENNQNWTSYGYYQLGEVSNYMWYQDVEYNNELYRGVYFTSYRPLYASTLANDYGYNTHQDDNGYLLSTVYWFKFEPLLWRVISSADNKATILCESIIDSKEFYPTTASRTINGQAISPNDWQYSTTRAWLSDSFYNTAFSDLEKEFILRTPLDNRTTGSSSKPDLKHNDTTDMVYLLSYEDMIKADYGFNTKPRQNDAARQKIGTDYAKAQGLYVNANDVGWWWLRSPETVRLINIACVLANGNVRDDNPIIITAGHSNGGVVPAMTIWFFD